MHPRVARLVAHFESQRDFFEGARLYRQRYGHRISAILREEGLPPELAHLPLIESAFSPHAVSPAGAVGLWQLVAGTGRRYGLRIDRYVDERRDPVKSTRAAAKYLKDLHAMFGDWHLSLAAYNSGEHAIAQLLVRHPSFTYWDLRQRGYLCAETADFVPKFLAAAQIAESPEAHGFSAVTEEPLRYDIVRVKRSLSLATVAVLSGTSASTIKELNPALHRGIVPPRGYALRVPKGAKQAFRTAYAALDRPIPPRRRTHGVTVGRLAEAQAPTRSAHRGG